MKKIISIVLIGVMFLAFVSCSKVVDIERTIVDGTVISTEYTPRRVRPVFAGKVTTLMTYPARHIVKIQYKDIVISVDDSELYTSYMGNIGATIKCNLTTKHYDNGKTTTHLEVRGDTNV